MLFITKGKPECVLVFTLLGLPSRLAEQKTALLHSHGGVCQRRPGRVAREGGICPGSPLRGCTAGGLPSRMAHWPELSPPSTGWILLVNNIFWHLSPLGKVCPQLLYRASGEQLAHSAGTQRLLYAIRPKRHPVGRQRGHYQRVYLGILDKDNG